ncbi:sodium:solute symporter family protein, partial [bacterium]|nr:sodium:solute symporter family protein [bacterium]
MIKWIIFLIYISITIYLAYLGNKKTQSLSSYAVGDRKMNPWIVAFALAASMTSTATFIINPGIVYA